ncbi:MAG: heavy metal translocating P-type ATPase [Bacillota bacterium]
MNTISGSDCAADNSCSCSNRPSWLETTQKPARIISYLFGAILFTSGLLMPLQGTAEFAVYFTVYLIFGGRVLLRAGRNIASGKVFDENFLMALATVGAFAIGEYPEGVAVMIFYQAGEYLQDYAVGRSRTSIQKLMDIRPDYARVIKNDQIVKLSPDRVPVGVTISVQPGERIPLDGKIVSGKSNLDLSALTGEFMPREVEMGDDVLSGSINKSGLLLIKVTKEYRQSTVSRILALVENAAARKAKTEKFITRFAAYYTPAVVGIAFVVAFIPPILFTGAVLSDWVYRALVFLVISCPCALVISIPLGFFGGIGGASRKGILVKGGNYLEALSQVDTVIFDKTGTLTRGEFEIDSLHPDNGFSEKGLLAYASIAANFSSHPVARSILKARHVKLDQGKVLQYHEISGRGVSLDYAGERILMGSRKLFEEESIEYKKNNSAGVQVYVAVNGIFAGSIGFSDQLKDDALNAIKLLRKMGIKNIAMLSGDRQHVARAIGSKLGLDHVFAELLPDQKVEMIEKLQQEKKTNKKHAFVGDGINDAPSLARADIGIAMGGVGSDAAIEAADIVLMTDQPSKLAEAIEIARKTKAIVIQNIALALGIKAIIMAFGLFDLASMWEAVFADVGVALLAVFNSMRALK